MHATCMHQAIAALISWPKERCKRAKTNFPPRILVLCVPKVESLTLSISLSRTLFSAQKLGAIPPLSEEKSTHARDSLLWERAIDTQTQAPEKGGKTPLDLHISVQWTRNDARLDGGQIPGEHT